MNQIKNLGLMWHAPVIPATEKDCVALLEVSRKIFATYQFEMPLTLTLINAKYMIAVFNIGYDKSSAAERLRAHAAYRKLNEETTRLGYMPYRCGLASKPINYYSTQQYDFLQKIKGALDPNKTLAPGRYGIGGEFEN